MAVNPREALAVLRAAAQDGRLDALCRRRQVRVLTVFGSVVRPQGHPRDVDVAVRFESTSPADLLGLLDDLAVLTGSDDLDLMDLGRAGPVARERGLVGCIALFESEPMAYALAQVASIGERMDSDWLLALDLETMRS